VPDVHAILSASASSRWLNCTPSARLESEVPEETSPFAEEGTRAHAVAEKRLKHFLETGSDYKRRLPGVDEEMWEATGRYVDTCIEKISAARQASKDAQIGIEVRLDFSDWVPEGFGTGDCVLVSDEYIEVIDLKYGKGVKVSAEGNTQMKLYALGAYAKYGSLYGFDRVRMTIVQPRIDNVSTLDTDVRKLAEWGKSIIPTAKSAFDGEGNRRAGDWCRFCKVRNACRALKDHMMEGVRTELGNSDLSPEEISGLVLKAKDIKRWLDGLEEFALQEALAGKAFPGLKLVAGRSTRKITNEDTAAAALQSAGYTDVWKPRQLQTLTALEKSVGKKKLAELLGDLIEKPEGKPTLVASTDKRPALTVEAVKADDFDDTVLN